MQLSHYLAILAVAATAASAGAPSHKAVHDGAASSQKVLHHEAASAHKTAHHNAATLHKGTHHDAKAAQKKVEHDSLYKATHHDGSVLRGAAHKLGKMELHNVANNLHLLASHMEQEAAVADKALHKLRTPSAVADKIEGMVTEMKSAVDQTTASLRKLLTQVEKRELVSVPSMAEVTAMFAKVPGCEKLTGVLASYDLPAGAEADVASVMTNVDLLKAIRSMANPAQFLDAVREGANSVALLQSLQGLAQPAQFVQAIVAVDSVPALVQAARADVPDFGQLVGGAQVVKYVDAHGSAMLVQLAAMAGASTLLEQIKTVAGSETFVTSLANVGNVERMVAGLRAIPDMDVFIAAVQEVQRTADIEAALDGLSQTTSIVGLRRDTASANIAGIEVAPKMLKMPQSFDAATVSNAVSSALHRRATDEVSASLTAVNKQMAQLIPRFQHMLQKLDAESDAKSAAAAAESITSVAPHFLQLTTVLTAAIKHGAPTLLPHVTKTAKVTDAMLLKLAHLS